MKKQPPFFLRIDSPRAWTIGFCSVGVFAGIVSGFQQEGLEGAFGAAFVGGVVGAVVGMLIGISVWLCCGAVGGLDRPAIAHDFRIVAVPVSETG